MEADRRGGDGRRRRSAQYEPRIERTGADRRSRGSNSSSSSDAAASGGRTRSWRGRDEQRAEDDRRAGPRDVKPIDWRRPKSATDTPATRPPPRHARESDREEVGLEDLDSKFGTLDAAPVQGECMAMCPAAEHDERERMKDVSRYERAPPGAEGAWAVKKYRRPAAGRIEINPQELRPPRVLLQTLEHLFTKVLPWPNCGFDWVCDDTVSSLPLASIPATRQQQQDFLSLYHFVSDRVRSVRQDFVVQRVHDATRVTALSWAARFYILAGHRATQLLPADATIDWSDTLNDQQLVSALTELHSLYERNQTGHTSANDQVTVHQEMVAYDIVLHAHDPGAVSLLLPKLHPQLLVSRLVRLVLAAFVALQTSDRYKFVQVLHKLPLLCHCLMLRHLPTIWVASLQRMNKAYLARDRFALDEIATKMHLADSSSASDLCRALNVHVESLVQRTEAVQTSVIPVADSWDDETKPLPVITPTPEQSQGGVAQFKVNPIGSTVEKNVEKELVARVAELTSRRHILPYYTASELVTATGACIK